MEKRILLDDQIGTPAGSPTGRVWYTSNETYVEALEMRNGIQQKGNEILFYRRQLISEYVKKIHNSEKPVKFN